MGIPYNHNIVTQHLNEIRSYFRKPPKDSAGPKDADNNASAMVRILRYILELWNTFPSQAMLSPSIIPGANMARSEIWIQIVPLRMDRSFKFRWFLDQTTINPNPTHLKEMYSPHHLKINLHDPSSHQTLELGTWASNLYLRYVLEIPENFQQHILQSYSNLMEKLSQCLEHLVLLNEDAVAIDHKYRECMNQMCIECVNLSKFEEFISEELLHRAVLTKEEFDSRRDTFLTKDIPNYPISSDSEELA
jgi:hypothetical protein